MEKIDIAIGAIKNLRDDNMNKQNIRDMIVNIELVILTIVVLYAIMR